MLDDSVVGDLADKGQRPFGADNEVEQNVERVLEIDKGVQTVAGGVLDLEFAPDTGGQVGVGQDFGPDGGQFVEKAPVGDGEVAAGHGIGRVQGLAVDEHEL